MMRMMNLPRPSPPRRPPPAGVDVGARRECPARGCGWPGVGGGAYGDRRSRGDAPPAAARASAVHVRSALPAGPVPYESGWAWQRVLLGRRLECRARRRARRLPDDDDDDDDDDDRDWLLLFEHEPTYTLGRGASVDHLTFLNDDRRGGAREGDRRRLDRSYRGADASRLQADDRCHRDGGISAEDEVDLVLSSCRSRAAAHPPVLAPNGAPVHRVERGGEVTFHGPGQLVMYPLLNLDDGGGGGNALYRKDLHWYLRSMEEVVMRTLFRYGLASERDPAGTGVWVDGLKIAAVGVSSSRWITTHGAALNVDVCLGYFDGDIVTPCGIGDRGVTSIARALGGGNDVGRGGSDRDRGGEPVRRCPTVEEVGRVASECFGEVFGVDLIHGKEIR
jgi:lipoyl(octanoyl) transferase